MLDFARIDEERSTKTLVELDLNASSQSRNNEVDQLYQNCSVP
jgi:hypothetical protein